MYPRISLLRDINSWLSWLPPPAPSRGTTSTTCPAPPAPSPGPPSTSPPSPPPPRDRRSGTACSPPTQTWYWRLDWPAETEVSQRPRWRLGGGPVETSWRELSWEMLTPPEITSIIFSARYSTDNCKYIFVRVESTFILYDVLTRKSHYSSNFPFSSLINVKLLDTFQELSLAITPRITHKQ